MFERRNWQQFGLTVRKHTWHILHWVLWSGCEEENLLMSWWTVWSGCEEEKLAYFVVKSRNGCLEEYMANLVLKTEEEYMAYPSVNGLEWLWERIHSTFCGGECTVTGVGYMAYFVVESVGFLWGGQSPRWAATPKKKKNCVYMCLCKASVWLRLSQSMRLWICTISMPPELWLYFRFNVKYFLHVYVCS
jgi:hypothetical protein